MELSAVLASPASLSLNMVSANAAVASVDTSFPIESIKERLQAFSSDCCSSNNYDQP
ncbi:MAG: hypothetical protein ABIW82_15765 [Dokdonella sp.]